MGSSKNAISEPVDAEEGYNMMVRYPVAINYMVEYFFSSKKNEFFVLGLIHKSVHVYLL